MRGANLIVRVAAAVGLLLSGCTAPTWFGGRTALRDADILGSVQDAGKGTAVATASTSQPTVSEPRDSNIAGDQPRREVTNWASAIPQLSSHDAATADSSMESVEKRLMLMEQADPQFYAVFKEAMQEQDPVARSLLMQRLEAELDYRKHKAMQKVAVLEPVKNITTHAARAIAADEYQRESRTENKINDDRPEVTVASVVRGAAPSGPSTTVPVTVTPAAETQRHVATVTLSEDPQNESPKPASRNEQLAKLIESLEHELRDTRVPGDERSRLEAHLRLLYVIADRRQDAVKPISQLDEPLREYWKHQLHGLNVSLDSQAVPMADRRSALALRHLREAVDHLAAAGTLDVRNLAFCTRVDSFGRYAEFSKYEFQANQEVLLYVEVDNFAVEQKPLGYETELLGSYQIFDNLGHRVADHSFPLEREVCRNRRRDFYIPYRMYMPKTIFPGTYTLHLTIEDAKARKFGQGTIEFTIRN